MSLHEYPKKPGISRFVAPWDTSGWYFIDNIEGDKKLCGYFRGIFTRKFIV